MRDRLFLTHSCRYGIRDSHPARIPNDMLMRLLVSCTKGIMIAIGITLPKPEQEKTVAIVWVVAFFVMIGIIAGVGWLVLKSFSNSPQ